jgi:chromosome segregation ATPase
MNFKLFQKYSLYKSDRMQPPVSSTPGKFSQPGSIVRLKFINFMQYKDTAFNCGPNLNVIIGPNGSGKSTIVNGICLGLAGKTSVLGRASSITDFIKVGEESAGTICFCL